VDVDPAFVCWHLVEVDHTIKVSKEHTISIIKAEVIPDDGTPTKKWL
jgi:hypothetical protein